MSGRAAWRLEALGFTDVYDYEGSKLDWFACGQPREGASAEIPWAGDLLHEDVPVCALDERVSDVRGRVDESGYDLCVVVGKQMIVFGLLRGDILAKDPDANAEDVMELGPRTIRPSRQVEKLLQRKSSHGVKSWIVSTSRGVLLGLLTRDAAEGALKAFATTARS